MMRRLALLFLAATVFGESNAPVNYGTQTHEIKKPPTTTFTACDFDFTGINVCGLTSSGVGTVTSFSAGNLSPLFTTSVTNPTSTPALSFSLSNAAAHSYLGNNTGSSGAPGYHVIDYSELAGTPTIPDAIFKTIQVSGQSDVVADSATDTLTLAAGSNITITTNAGTDTVTVAAAGAAAPVGTIGFTTDGAGSTITTGVKGYFTVPFSGSITHWAITADGSSPTCTIDVWKIATGTALPTVANTIMGTKPALSSGNAIRSTTMTGWTTTFTAGDIFGFNIDAVTVATKLTFTLEVTQ